ncbi:transposase [Cucumis melo var. makuwa]|uniref:Transposase n=1 Tax=Cucumis melo var. makuwa TaxID=1194695 RepID=A0A5D3CUK0_CUCMM|nr:transposase [Cucumis melo var. makuwa]
MGNVVEQCCRRLFHEYSITRVGVDKDVVVLGSSEIDIYLLEVNVRTEGNFDILQWWKMNNDRFEVLGHMARDILAIPVSTIEFESAFSTGGCVVDSSCCSLNWKRLQNLKKDSGWLWRMKRSLKTFQILISGQLPTRRLLTNSDSRLETAAEADFPTPCRLVVGSGRFGRKTDLDCPLLTLSEELESIGFAKWSRAYSPRRIYNVMTTNISESLNSAKLKARELPICSMLEILRIMLQRWFLNEEMKLIIK